MRLIIYTLIILISVLEVKAQSKIEEGKPSIAVMARSFGDSIILRWSPTTPMAWKQGNKQGYIIEKYIVRKDNKQDKKLKPEKVFTSDLIKPWSLEKWEVFVNKNDFGIIAAQAIYGKSFQMLEKSSDVMRAVSLSQELEQRFSFAVFSAEQSLKVAEACGLKFADSNVKKGEKYVYKIYMNGSTPNYLVDTGYVFIGTDEKFPLPKPVQLKAEFGNRAVMLSWNKTYYEHIYTTYFIERSSDGGLTFERTSQLPIVNTSPTPENKAENIYKVDSLPDNVKNYVFRVRGTTPFEEIGPPSDTVQGKGKEHALQVSPSIISVENQKDASILIKWIFPENYTNKIKEFEILRSTKVNGVYTSLSKVLSASREYKDLNPGRTNYYVVKAIDNSSSFSVSFPALGQPVDSIPPSSPQGVTGKIDKAGLLVLHWKKGSESDISGYRIYMANSKQEGFTQVTREPVRDTVYIDSINLNTITSKVYYKVMALDLNYNLSSFSETVEINRPDIIPPVAPVIETYKASDTAIYFKWIASSSEDVVKHILYRREKNSTVWNPIFQNTNMQITEYADKDLRSKKVYEYVVVAVDEANLESEKKQIVTVSLIDAGFRPEIKGVETKIDRQKKQVEIKWEYLPGKPEKFLIYRSVKGNPLREYRSISGTERVFVDKSLQMNTEYTYRIKAIFPDGASSPLSKEISIKY